MPNCSRNIQQMSSICDATSIQETADSLVIIRADTTLAKPFEVDDPFAQLFVTEAGKRMASMVISVDTCYVAFNLVRYRHITERIRDAITRYHQILFLGAGYDTRAISMPEFGGNPVEVFEVDYPEKLTSKQHKAGGQDFSTGRAVIHDQHANAVQIGWRDTFHISPRCLFVKTRGEPELRTLTFFAAYAGLTSHQLGQLSGYGQAKTGSPVLASGRGVRLADLRS
jgi:hypothetical protein